jgi:hypothetical protein
MVAASPSAAALCSEFPRSNRVALRLQQWNRGILLGYHLRSPSWVELPPAASGWMNRFGSHSPSLAPFIARINEPGVLLTHPYENGSFFSSEWSGPLGGDPSFPASPTCAVRVPPL